MDDRCVMRWALIHWDKSAGWIFYDHVALVGFFIMRGCPNLLRSRHLIPNMHIRFFFLAENDTGDIVTHPLRRESLAGGAEITSTTLVLKRFSSYL